MVARFTRRRALASGVATCVQTSFVPRTAWARQSTAPFITGVSAAEKSTVAKLGELLRSKFDLPGVSLAMSYRGQLKLLACFGYANVEKQLALRPHHQFRIASVSKPITSVGILRLLELQRLTLDDRVFTSGQPLAAYTNEIQDTHQRQLLERITIRHLLEHTCGGWSNQRGVAPMFATEALGLSHSELIRWTLKNRPLANEPGRSYAYSNFGYCLLGRIIEAKTGKDYQRAMKDLVLNQVGAKSTCVGRRKQAERQPQEVTYYDKFDPYGNNMDVARMDSHGGWISTPADMLRFAVAVDGYRRPQDILQPSTLTTMTTPRQGSYALGWNVNESNNWWHTGSFNGASSILVRTNDGHSWAAVVNTRSSQEGYSIALDQFLWQVKDAIKRWGSHDLFAARQSTAD